MRMGYKITLSVLTIMILMTISVGTSYSYYAVSSTQKTPNFISTSCFEITFDDEDSINLDKAYPMSEDMALSKSKPYKFTITNACTTEKASADIKYILTLNTLTGKSTKLAPYLNHKLVTNKGLDEDALIRVYAGDINNDSKVDSSDSTMIMRLLAGTRNEAQNVVGDKNNDGKADSSDATIILRELTELDKKTTYIKTIPYSLDGASAYGLNNTTLNNRLLYVKYWEKSNGKISNLPTTDENIKLSLLESEVGSDIDISYNIDISSLAPGESVNYSLYLWIDENACDNNKIINGDGQTECEAYVMGKSFEGKIALYAYM